MTKIIVFFFFLTFGISHSQELNCVVTVDSKQLSNANQQVFKTLSTSLTDLVNKTRWTDLSLNQSEKIECSMYINVSENNSDQFTATIQVQSSRPVYNSSYSSPVFNFNDQDFSFSYTEFENIRFNSTDFESNLISVISFYSYIILGMDADSFEKFGGTKYFEIAQDISNSAQQEGYKGWGQSDGSLTRYYLINDLLSGTYKDVRQVVYDYNSGLDLMSQDLNEAKEKIKSSLIDLGKFSKTRRNALLTRVFFDSKADEISSVFSGGPSTPIVDLVDLLNSASPLNSSKWALIKY
jgi:hypothetical protein